MSYLVQISDGRWLYRNKPVVRIDNASIYPHPSAAKNALASNHGAKLVPFAEIEDEWHAARKAYGKSMDPMKFQARAFRFVIRDGEAS